MGVMSQEMNNFYYLQWSFIRFWTCVCKKILISFLKWDKHPEQSLISVKLFVFQYKPEKFVKL